MQNFHEANLEYSDFLLEIISLPLLELRKLLLVHFEELLEDSVVKIELPSLGVDVGRQHHAGLDLIKGESHAVWGEVVHSTG